MAKKRNRSAMKKRIVAILALILVVLLIVTSIFYSISDALAESEERDQYTIEIAFSEDFQALQIQQRLVFHNPTSETLDAVEFYLAPNIFRRESALFYDNDDLTACFPSGYAPGGLEIGTVLADGKTVTWGVVGESEIYLRVYAEVQPYGTCTFDLSYAILLTANRSFLGFYDTDIRLSGFYAAACTYDPCESAYIRTSPMSYTRWMYSAYADFDVSLALPDAYTVAATGEEESVSIGDGGTAWHISAENVQEFSLIISPVWNTGSVVSESGTEIRMMSEKKNTSAILSAAREAVNACEEWFGAFPYPELDIVASDYALNGAAFPGMIWLNEDLPQKDANALKHTLRRLIAMQYFGLASRAEPVTDAWLSDAVSNYTAYLLLERAEDSDAMLEQMRSDLLASLQITIPGGSNVTSDASIFQDRPDEYEIIVLDRGTAVLHQLRTVMGTDRFLTALRTFCEAGRDGTVLTERDFVDALDSTGGSWEDFLTDWIFNFSDYTQNTDDWFISIK